MTQPQNRYDTLQNFVTPETVDGSWQRTPPAQLPAPLPPSAARPADAIALAGGRPLAAPKGSHAERQRALERKFAAVVLVEAITIAGVLLLAWMGTQQGAPYYAAGWIVLTGVAAFVSFGWLNQQDHAHSPSGVERQRNRLSADVATETHETAVSAWRDVRLAEIDAYYGYLERSDQRRYEQPAERRQLSQRD